MNLRVRLCAVLAVAGLLWAPMAHAKITAVHGEGFLELTDNGMKVAHIKGAPYEMGYQYGTFFADEILGISQAVNEAARREFDIPDGLTNAVKYLGGALFKPYFKADELTMLQGVLDAVHALRPNEELSLEQLIFFNSLVDAGALAGAVTINCDSFCAWGSLTEGGKMFQTRNIDLFIGYGLENFPAVEIAKPTGGVPIANIGYSGMLGMVSGMNAKGMALGQVYAKGTANQLGRPWPMDVRAVMAAGGSAEDMADTFQRCQSRTYGCNFVFGDPGLGYAVAVESNSHNCAKFYSMDPAELELKFNGETCAIQIPECVFRGDASFYPPIRAEQVSSNGPDGDMREAGAYKNRYKGQADRIIAYRDAGVRIGAQEAITISKETAMPDASLQCVVYANEDLEFWVANSVIDDKGHATGAYAQEYKHYNFNAVAPTVDFDLKTPVVTEGAMLTLDVTLQNYGTPKQLDLYVVLDANGEYFYLQGLGAHFAPPNFQTTPKGLTYRMKSTEVRKDNLIDFKMPKGIQSGKVTFYGALFDHATETLSDLSVRTLEFQGK